MTGYLGFGRADRCPNCGSETKNADDEGVRICLACGEHHRRDETGRLILSDPEDAENA
jgi:RNA polymerase subunit RPABC4/transcription elongation factor Spt4